MKGWDKKSTQETVYCHRKGAEMAQVSVPLNPVLLLKTAASIQIYI
jgi:hypothetical protein